jgi:hypothetical protein
LHRRELSRQRHRSGAADRDRRRRDLHIETSPAAVNTVGTPNVVAARRPACWLTSRRSLRHPLTTTAMMTDGETLAAAVAPVVASTPIDFVVSPKQAARLTQISSR